MTALHDTIDILKTSVLFQGVSPELIKHALNNSVQIALTQGQKLLSRETVNQQVFIVMSGRLSVNLDDAGHKIIELIGRGDCIGEMSLFNERYASVVVVAATDCMLLVIEPDTVWSLIHKSHEIAHNMLQILSRRIHVSDQVIAQNIEHQQGYQGLNLVDSLTGLYNRNWLQKELGRYLTRSKQDNKKSCLMLLEIDGYEKYVRDFGEIGGEQAIRKVASTVLDCIRPEDQAGRNYGAQLVVHLPNVLSLDEACVVANRLINSMANATIVLPTGDCLPSVTLSVGVSLAVNNNAAELFLEAESALRNAQTKGGNCVGIN
ncbi:MAG: GGDEF domain-containing protein [Gallionellaceae bacterium]|jgi:diguanylate cyclase (GGDEF)-like protein